MLRSARLATPLLLVVCVVVPESVPPPGFVLMDSVTDAPGTRLRNRSFTVTLTAGVMCSPAVVLLGCTVNAAVAGAAAVMLNAALSWVTAAGVLGTVASSVYPTPVLSMLRSAKLASPLLLVVCVVVPESVPLPGLVLMVSVTEALGTRLKNRSFTVTWTAGVMWSPAVVVVGCTVNAAVAGAAAVMSKAALSCVTSPDVLGTVASSV